jgi:hypothetical protein
MANVSANQDDILWMVIRMDIHGTKFLIKDGRPCGILMI